MTEAGIKPNIVTFNSLIDVWVRCGQTDKAWDIFRMMEGDDENDGQDNSNTKHWKQLSTNSAEYDEIQRNFTYWTLIKGINQTGNQAQDNLNLDRAFKLLDKMKSNNERPDEIFYNWLIDVCIRLRDINRAVAVFNEMQMANVKPSSVTYGILIKAYGRSNQLDNAFNVFLKMKEQKLQPNDVTYGCLIDAWIRNNNIEKAEEVFRSMEEDQAIINTIIYTTMIKGYSKAHRIDEALALYSKMKLSPNIEPNNVTYNSLIDWWVRCNEIDKASTLFDEMKERNVKPDLITFSTLIKGYFKQAEYNSNK